MSTLEHCPSRQRHAWFVSLVALAAGAWLSGCAGISAKGTWEDGVPHQTFSRVLVVGVSPNRNLRCAFESTLASQLKSESTTVIQSCDQMNSKEELTRQNIERVVASVHADAVLATRLVSMQAGEREGRSNDTRGDSRYKATDFAYGAYGMPVTYAEFQTAPPLSAITSSVHVVTKVYDTRDGKLLYTLDTATKAQEVDSTEATLMTITIPTAQRLRRDGLVR
ncbi:MAG TPA: hypothetical protein VGI91_09250 [Steroidobacteraceae bacterium]